jgi:arylsulfatase A-like enzyme
MQAGDSSARPALAASIAPRIAALSMLSVLPMIAGGCGSAARPGTPPESVILVTVDTLRADHVSFWGYPRTTTWIDFSPEQRARGEALAIDDLAASGVSFARAFAPRGMTFPSLATLMTGRPPLEHGALANGDALPAREETLAERFAAAGFETAAFTANRLLVPGSGIEQGFARFEAFPPPGSAEASDPAYDKDYAAVRAAVAWLAELKARPVVPPFFAWVHLVGPHLPYAPLPLGRDDFRTLYADPDYAGSADGSRELLDAVHARARTLDAQDQERVVALYDGEIARVNALVRSLATSAAGVFDPAQKRVDLLARSVLVFTADHGEELLQRNAYAGHSKSVYDSVLSVPLVLRHPGSLTGRRVLAEVVELQDLAPTLYEWFELEPPAGLRGRSLLALTDSYAEKEWTTRPAFGTWSDRIFTVRTRDWRLVVNPEGIEPQEEPPGAYPVPEVALYDHRAGLAGDDADPFEQRDVAAEHPDVVRALTRELEAWRARLQRAAAAERAAPGAAIDAALEDLGYAARTDGAGQ